MRVCKKCARELKADEVGLNLKLIDRSGKEFLCIDCLAAYLKLPREDLIAMADRFRKTGCVLFPKKPSSL